MKNVLLNSSDNLQITQYKKIFIINFKLLHINENAFLLDSCERD